MKVTTASNKSLLAIGVVLMLGFSVNSKAGLMGSSYLYNVLATGSTQIGLTTPGSYSDPANPGFCVRKPVACNIGSGISGSFSFADVTPILSTITFKFFGSTPSGVSAATFIIDLGDFFL